MESTFPLLEQFPPSVQLAVPGILDFHPRRLLRRVPPVPALGDDTLEIQAADGSKEFGSIDVNSGLSPSVFRMTLVGVANLHPLNCP